MSHATIPPAFPGSIERYADQAPALWEAFAEATVTRDPAAAAPLGRRLARQARHRKPNRRRGVIARGLGTLLLLAAVLTMAGAAVYAATYPAFYGMSPGQVQQVSTMLDAPAVTLDAYVKATPAQEAAACTAAQDIHAHQQQGVKIPSAVWWHAWRLAGHADRDLERAERHWLETGQDWPEVLHLCGYGL